jgi:hypothetical protein
MLCCKKRRQFQVSGHTHTPRGIGLLSAKNLLLVTYRCLVTASPSKEAVTKAAHKFVPVATKSSLSFRFDHEQGCRGLKGYAG